MAFLSSFLILYFIDVNKINSHEETAVTLVMGCYNPKLTKAVLKAGADIHSTNSNGTTLLHLAAYTAQHSIAKYLVKQGIDKEAEDQDGNTALDIVTNNADYYYYELTDELIEIYGSG